MSYCTCTCNIVHVHVILYKCHTVHVNTICTCSFHAIHTYILLYHDNCLMWLYFTSSKIELVERQDKHSSLHSYHYFPLISQYFCLKLTCLRIRTRYNTILRCMGNATITMQEWLVLFRWG